MDTTMELDDAPGPSTRNNMIHITEPSPPSFPQKPYAYHALDRTQNPAICIDNGSHSWRAGFSTMAEPYIDKTNAIARYKDKKSGRQVMLFGNDVEADSASKTNIRQMFDGDLLVHQDLLEVALDYTFLTLGIDSSRLEQPVIMSEKLANPLFSRAITSELLFELYNAPSVTYGIDSLFAFSRQQHQDGLSINMGHSATTVIPVLNGKGVLSRAKRIPWGGAQASELMLKLAQLKYPSFPTKVTTQQATFMTHETCYFSADYESELKSLEDPANMSNMTKVVQFPFTVPEVVEKTEEEIAAALERRREHGKRLQEMQSKQRAEKLAAKMVELEEYQHLQSQRPNMKKADFLSRLSENTPFETEAELESWIKKTEAEIKRKQRKDQGLDDEPEEEPSFPMVDRPDEELNEDELREKKKQRLMKAGWEARVKIRAEKQRERERVEEEKRQEESERLRDPEGWALKLKEEQEAVILRIQERKKKRAQLGDRKSAQSQARMKSIATLAAEEKVGKKRKKGGDEKDDGFGRDDSDWAVYREIGGDDDSDAEEEDQTQLQSIETRLLQHDPGFTEDHTMEGRVHVKHALVNSFVRGGTDERYDPVNLAQNHQLHLNVERIRVPETWFQPGMFGIDSAGVGEVAGWVLNGFEEAERRRLMQCIFVTGGSSITPGILTKMRNVLTPVLPFRAPLKIVSSWEGGDPRFEAWKGMASWAGTEAARQARVTKAEYDEFGAEWLKEHQWGNPTP